MGFFSNLFGGEKEYPVLEPSSAAAQRLSRFNSEIETFVNKVSDKFELVPAEDTLYIFIGNPPGMFGMAWFIVGEVKEHNFKTLMKDKGLSQRKMQTLSDDLREAYTRSESSERFSVTIGGKKIKVTPSEVLAEEVHQIIQKVSV